jgi:hypothetical protein
MTEWRHVPYSARQADGGTQRGEGTMRDEAKAVQFRLPIDLNNWTLKGRTDVCGVAGRPIAWTVGLSVIRQLCLQAASRDRRNVRV